VQFTPSTQLELVRVVVHFVPPLPAEVRSVPLPTTERHESGAGWQTSTFEFVRPLTNVVYRIGWPQAN
jgi:hypothetical protein